MELFDTFRTYLGKAFKVRTIFIMYMIGVVAGIVILISALSLADNMPIVASNTSGQNIVLTQEFLKGEFQQYYDSNIFPEFVAFIIITVIGVISFIFPLVLLIASLKMRSFKWSYLLYLIPLPVVALICAFFSYIMGASSIPHFDDENKTFTVQKVTVTTMEKIPVENQNKDNKVIIYHYYMAFDNGKKFRVDDDDYNLFLENGTEYYLAKSATGANIRYYPISSFDLE